MWMVPFSGYRMDIQQGNAVTKEMVSKLKPGMTRAQVRYALGTPLLVDAFRTDRWDYVYYYDKPNEPRVYHHLVVVFKGDKLERFEGDVLPTNDYEIGAVSPEKTSTTADGKPASAAGSTAAGENAKAPGKTSTTADGKPASAAGSTTTGENAKANGQTAPSKEAPSTSDEKKPAAQAPAKEGGYSKPIMDSLGF